MEHTKIKHNICSKVIQNTVCNAKCVILIYINSYLCYASKNVVYSEGVTFSGLSPNMPILNDYETASQ